MTRRSLLIAGITTTMLAVAGCSSGGGERPVTPASSVVGPSAHPGSELPAPFDEAAVWGELQQARSEELRGLAPMREAFAGKLPDSVVTFHVLPLTPDEARDQAQTDAPIYREFAETGIRPLVIVEPNTEGFSDDEVKRGQQATALYERYASGAEDESLRTYFQALKDAGVTAEQLGLIVPFPESNAPNFGVTPRPDTLAKATTRYLHVQKNVFPDSKFGVLFDGGTCVPGSTNWDGAITADLSAYTAALQHQLAASGGSYKIDSVGLQGFPSPLEPSKAEAAQMNAADYLPTGGVLGMIKTLGAPEAWINTGTPASLAANDRGRLIGQTVQIASGMQTATGSKVTLNWFAPDKTGVETNWSFNKNPQLAAATVMQTRQAGLELSWFNAR